VKAFLPAAKLVHDDDVAERRIVVCTGKLQLLQFIRPRLMCARALCMPDLKSLSIPLYRC